jgi:hypothetical protein
VWVEGSQPRSVCTNAVNHCPCTLLSEWIHKALCLCMCAPAGSRAWAGLTHEAILEAVNGPWQLAVPPGLPPVLQELVLAALAKDPKDR